jgi:hypothetical protein
MDEPVPEEPALPADINRKRAATNGSANDTNKLVRAAAIWVKALTSRGVPMCLAFCFPCRPHSRTHRKMPTRSLGDGQGYEQATFEGWLCTGNAKSPNFEAGRQ